MTENSIPDLLKLAGVPASDKAVAWLEEAIVGARSAHRIAKKRPLAADHNALFADIEKSAKELTRGIDRLRRYPSSRVAFWRSKAFGPVYGDRVEVHEVLSTLEDIVHAADMAKDQRKGRRRETGKQNVVNLAFGFFVKHSRQRLSGTPTGAFARFARAFYVAATGDNPEEGGLDRQIRQAAYAPRRRASAHTTKVRRKT